MADHMIDRGADRARKALISEAGGDAAERARLAHDDVIDLLCAHADTDLALHRVEDQRIDAPRLPTAGDLLLGFDHRRGRRVKTGGTQAGKMFLDALAGAAAPLLHGKRRLARKRTFFQMIRHIKIRFPYCI